MPFYDDILYRYQIIRYKFQLITMKQQGKINREEVPEVLQSHLPEYKHKLLKMKSTLGMTNQTFKVTGEGLDPIIFRILNPIIDRKYQNQVLQKLDAQKLCPKNIYNCQEYRIQEFVENANHPSTHQINSDEHLLKLILAKLHEVHKIKLPAELKKSFLNDIVFSEKSKEKYSKTTCQQNGREKDFQQAKKYLLGKFDSFMGQIQHHFKERNHKLKLCHNDVNNNNIFIRKNQGTQEVIFIDFQYACLNYVAYDIANLLNQCCFDYMKKMPGFEVYKKVTQQQVSRACSFYPGKYKNIEDDVKFMLGVCNFYWALWSLEAHPTPNFSTVEHCIARIELYKFYSQKFMKQ